MASLILSVGPALRRPGKPCCRAAPQRKRCAPRMQGVAAEVSLAWDELVGAAATGPTLVAVGPTPLGRGLLATQAVDPGQPLVSVPLANALAVSDEPGGAFGRAALAEWQAAHGRLPPLLAGFILGGSRADWFLRLTAWLLWLAKHPGSAGPWQQYVGLLPTEPEMTCLMNFREEELSELQSPSLEVLARKERKSILGVHDLVFGSTMGELKALTLAESPDDTVWAAVCVNSRCFSEQVGGEAVSLLVPCADMANHLLPPNASYRLQPEARVFQLAAEAPLGPGQEACISYHHGKSNEELMRDSGFIIPGNPLDRIKFGTAVKPASAAQFGALLRAASSGGGAGGGASSTSSSSTSSGDATRSLDLKRLMRALKIPARVQNGRLELPAVPATPDQGRRTAVLLSLQGHLRVGPAPGAAGSGGSSGDGPTTDAALAEERRCAADLLQEARGMLAAHATSAATDEALLAGAEGALLPRLRQAVEVRLERKRLLQSAIDVLEAYSAGLE